MKRLGLLVLVGFLLAPWSVNASGPYRGVQAMTISGTGTSADGGYSYSDYWSQYYGSPCMYKNDNSQGSTIQWGLFSMAGLDYQVDGVPVKWFLSDLSMENPWYCTDDSPRTGWHINPARPEFTTLPVVDWVESGATNGPSTNSASGGPVSHSDCSELQIVAWVGVGVSTGLAFWFLGMALRAPFKAFRAVFDGRD